MFKEELKNWKIEQIIPVETAKKYAEVLKNYSHKEFNDLVEKLLNSEYWSSEKTYSREAGALFIGAYIFESEGAFGDWVLCKSNHHRTSCILYVWNNKTEQRIYIDDFTLYVLITEFQIHKFNSLHIDASEGGIYKLNKKTGNTEKFIDGKVVEVIPPLNK